jgi:hypothetical protein
LLVIEDLSRTTGRPKSSLPLAGHPSVDGERCGDNRRTE